MKSMPKTHGISLVEALIGIAIIVAAVIAAFLYYGIALKVAKQSTDRVQAAIILTETAEALRTMRDAGWSNISSLSEGVEYSMNFTGTSWQATTTPQLVESRFARTFSISPVYRDGNDDIVISGGTLDPETKRFLIKVEWVNSGGFSSESQMYLANIFD